MTAAGGTLTVPSDGGTLTIAAGGAYTYTVGSGHEDLAHDGTTRKCSPTGSPTAAPRARKRPRPPSPSPSTARTMRPGWGTPPSRTTRTSIDEDDTLTFAATDFDFNDVDAGADALSSITITALPVIAGTSTSAGSLQLNNGNVAVNQTIAVADIPNLVFTPANRSADYEVEIDYTVTDDSGESNNTSTASGTLTIPVTASQDAPVLTAAGMRLDGSEQSLPQMESVTRLALEAASALFEATDEDDTTLTYGIVVTDASNAAATWLTLNASGVFTGTAPARTASATYSVSVTATADSLMATVAFTINITLGLQAVADAVAVNEGATAAVTMTTAGSNNTTFTGNDAGQPKTLVGYNAGNSYVDATAEKGNGPVPGMYGTLTIMSSGTFTYVLDNANTDVSALRHGATLTDFFSYQITDGTDNSPAIITVTITGVNDTPRTGGGAITVAEEATHSFALSDFDFMDDDDGDALGSISISAAPSMGALSRSDGVAFTYPVIVLASEIPSLVFTPENRSDGYSASFMYTVSDNSLQSNAVSATAAMAITVTGGEDAPNLTAAGTALDGGSRGYSVGTDISTQLASAAPLFEIVDTGDVLSYGVEVEDADDAAASWLTIDATTGAFTGTVPPLSMGATYTVTVRATATPSGAESMTLSFTINVTQSPRPAADPVAVTEGATAAVTTTSDGARTNLFDNDLGLDDEGDTETLVGYSAGATYDAANAETSNGAVAGTYGSLTIMNDGTFSYALDNDDADTQALAMGTMMDDVFTYRISDRAAAHADHGTRFADGRVTVTVAGANDAPVAVGTIADVTATEDMDEAGMFMVSGTAFMDPDTGETATLTWNLRLLSSDGMSTENLPGWVMLQADRAMTSFGQVSYSPTTNDHDGDKHLQADSD